MMPYSKAATVFAKNYEGDDYDGELVMHNLDTMSVIVSAYDTNGELVPNIYIRVVTRNSVRVSAPGAETVVIVG